MFPVEDMIVLACADRYLCSHRSVGMRAWSSIRVANRVIPFAILLGFLAYSHVPILFQIEIHPMTQKPICYRPDASGTYHIVLSYFHLIYFWFISIVLYAFVWSAGSSKHWKIQAKCCGTFNYYYYYYGKCSQSNHSDRRIDRCFVCCWFKFWYIVRQDWHFLLVSS